jgi:hypothetical protein
MPSYSVEELKEYCEEHNVELLQKYDVKATSKTYIIGKCVTEGCCEIFNKLYSVLLTAGPHCKQCSKKVGNKRRSETNMQLYGCEFVSQKDDFAEKRKETNLAKYGVEHVTQNKDVREKGKATNLERYGVDFAAQSTAIKEKKVQNSLVKHGVEYPSQTKEFQDKVTATCMEKYGHKRASSSQDVKDKVKTTSMERFGATNAMKNEEIKEKYKQGCVESFGFQNPLQNPEISEKMMKSCFKTKDYTFPSGRVVQIQGYENFGIDDMLKDENVAEDDIIVSRPDVPVIWYDDKDGIKRRYFVDIYIPSQKRGIEVKSTWTVKKDYVFEKQQAMKNAGYQCEVWVYDKGQRIECHK